LDIEAGNFTYNTSVSHSHEGSIGNLCTEQIKKQMQKVVDSFPFVAVQSTLSRLTNP
jgi:argininosuccinate lyase